MCPCVLLGHMDPYLTQKILQSRFLSQVLWAQAMECLVWELRAEVEGTSPSLPGSHPLSGDRFI